MGARLSRVPPEGKDDLSRERCRQRELAFHTAEKIKALLGPECFLTDHPRGRGGRAGICSGICLERGEGFWVCLGKFLQQRPGCVDDSMETSSQLDVGAGGSKVLLLLWDPVTPRVFPWHWGSSADAQGPALHPGQRNIGMLFLAPPWRFLEVTATFES